MDNLEKLIEPLKSEIEKALWHEVFIIFKPSSKQWGLYATAEGTDKGNFGIIRKKVRSDKWHPDFPLPHLVVSTKKDWTVHVPVTYDSVQLAGIDRVKEDQISWCIPQEDYTKLKRVAWYLAEIYRAIPPQLEWLNKKDK